MRQNSGFRTAFLIAGLLAAAALMARGILDLPGGTGWPPILVALALLAAVALRWFVYRG